MFKVGDKVEVKGYTEEWDGKGVVKEIFHDVILVEFDRQLPRDRGGFPPQYVHKIDSQSPVRTVTRREIVPGTYGRVKVTKGLYVHCNSMSTAEELRESAHILNQLAEALEDKS